MERRTFLKAASAAGISVVGFNPLAALAANTSLRIATWVPPTHHQTAVTLPRWIDAISKASDGSLKLTIDPAPIAPPPEQYNIIRAGAADIAYHVAAYTPGPFEVARGIEMPFMSPSAEVGSMATVDWYERNIGFDAEFKDVKVLTIFVHGPGVLHSKEPIHTLDDFQNVKVRVGGGGVRMAEALGAAPVAMPASQAYESLQKGVADAAMFPWEAIKGFRLYELVDNHLEIPGGLYTTFFAVIMNRGKWDALPDEHKQVLTEFGGLKGAQIFGKGWDDADVAGKKTATDNGHTISVLSEEEQPKWAEKVAFVEDDWVKLANERGYDGAALLEDLKATVKKYNS